MDISKKTKEIEERREFLKKAGRAAVVAPAVALLLSAASKSASAGPTAYGIVPDTES